MRGNTIRSWGIVFFVAACIISFVSFFLPTPGFAADVIRLKYSNFAPPAHGLSILSDQWGKELEKRTNGRVKVAFFPGGTLVSANATYDSVVKGIVDVGFSIMSYTPGHLRHVCGDRHS